MSTLIIVYFTAINGVEAVFLVKVSSNILKRLNIVKFFSPGVMKFIFHETSAQSSKYNVYQE